MAYRLSIVIMAAFCAATTFWMFLPLLSVSLRHEGVDDFWVGIISSLPWVGVLAMSGFIPAITRRFGLKRTIIIGIGFSILAFLGFAAFRVIWVWALLSLLMGTALAMRWAALDSWMNGSFPARLRGRLTGLYELVMSGSIAVGPAILALSGNTSYVPFLLAALVLMLSAGVIEFVGQESARVVQASLSPPRRLTMLLQESEAFTGIFMVGLTEAANLSLLPIFGLTSGLSVHLSALLVVMVQIGGALGALVIGGVADHLNRIVLRNSCACIMVIMPIGLAVVGLHAALWPWLILWGIVQGGLFTVGIISLASRHAGGGLTTAITLSMVIYTGGGIVGPPVIGALISLLGRNGFIVGMAAMALAGSILIMRRRAIQAS